jgi:hypothetical protein
MYQPNPSELGGEDSGGVPTGKCSCAEWKVETPGADQPIRRLLFALKEAVRDLPPDVVKKFEDELKDAEKEAQGVLAIVNKYKEFYDKLDCKLAEAKTWKADIARWLEGKIDQATADAIKKFRRENYDDVEKKICCGWIDLRDRLNLMRDCLEQAKRTEEERKKDYEDFKAFEKTLGDRFALLKSLYDQAKSFLAEQRFKTVFAVSLEFDEVYNKIGIFRDWAYARSQCPKPADGYGQSGEEEQPEGEYAEGYGPSAGGLKNRWPPEKFKAKLTGNLRELILARYQRFRWQYEFQSKTADSAQGEKDCKAFRDDRQKQFIDEADEIPVPESSGGGGGEGGEQQQTGDYSEQPPTGGYPEPPAAGGYQQKPPAGNYPDIPNPPPGGYDDTPAPPDTYPGRKKY